MKTKFLIFACTSILFGCTAQEYPELQNEEPQPIVNNESNIRSADEAVKIAVTGYKSFFGSLKQSRSLQEYSLNAIPVGSKRMSRTDNDTLIYVVNFPDEAGFAIVSANKENEPILAISDQGNYDPFDSSSNPPGMNLYINQINESLQEGIIVGPPHPVTPPDTAKEIRTAYMDRRDTTNNESVSAKVKAKWGQRSYYGQNCPNQTVGCGPLAIAMALSSIKVPSYINVGEPPVMPVECKWDVWSNFGWLNGYISSSYYNEYKTEIDHLSLVLRRIGIMCNAVYNNDLTTTTTFDNCKAAVNSLLKHSDYVTSDDIELREISMPEYRYLIYNGLLFMAGRDQEERDGSQEHAWIVDGYKYCRSIFRHYEKKETELVWRIISESDPHSTFYYHINWGYSGQGNGYYICPTVGGLNSLDDLVDGPTLSFGHKNKFFAIIPPNPQLYVPNFLDI